MPAEARGDATRDRLITAAMHAFANKGFHGCTTRDIAAEAGMSPAAVYVHYKSKEELLFVISQEGHQISLDRIRSDQRSETSPVRQLEAMMRGFVFDHADGHVRARVNNYELDHLSPEHFRIIAGMRREIEERFFDVIVAGQRSGEFAPGDARMMTRALISLGVDTARWFRADGMSTAADIADNYVTFALRMVAAPTMRNATSP